VRVIVEIIGLYKHLILSPIYILKCEYFAVPIIIVNINTHIIQNLNAKQKYSYYRKIRLIELSKHIHLVEIQLWISKTFR